MNKHNPKLRYRILTSALALGILTSGWCGLRPVFAQFVPNQSVIITDSIGKISLSASLFGSDNRIVTNGTYAVRIALYSKNREIMDVYPSNADAGSRLWEETQTVTLKNGIFRAFLGAVTPLPASVNFANGDYYIGIRIGTDSEMIPRKRLGAVPRAINSQYLQGKTIGTESGNIPLLGKSGTLDIKLLPSDTSFLGDTIELEDEVTGILPIENGGTGQSDTPGNGQILIGNGSGFTLGTISSASITPDDLDFTEFQDQLDLDASTDIALGALTLSTSGTGPVSFNNTGLFTVAGSIDFNGTANDIAGTLNLSGGALTSTGALTLTPQAGSNLNINLSTTGDFAVNGSQLYVDTSTGHVGFGVATPQALLDLLQPANGTPIISAHRITDIAPSGDFINYMTSAGLTLFRVDNSGNLFAGGIINSGSQTITSTSQPQFRIQYDAADEITVSVSPVGATTLGLNGSAPALIFTPGSNNVNTFNFTDAASTSILSIDTQNQRVGIGTTTPASLFSVGATSQFQIDATGAIVAATGITSSGPITFSSLSAGGVVQATPGTGLLFVSTLGAASITPDSLDFTEFQDQLDLDASTDIALGALTLSTSGTGPVSFNNTGLFTVAGSIDFNGTANDIAGTLNLSGGALTSTGALTLTPQAGSNLNINLSTTGDFAVNGSQLYVDTSTGNVGIGTITPASLFSVGATSQFQVNSAGAIASATGITSSGPITFSGFSAGGVVQATPGTGLLFVSTTIGAASITPDSLDFTEFQDQLDLDASTDILATGTNVLSITNSGTGNSFLVNDVAADTTPFVIDQNGNVGIGTVAPLTILDISTTDSTSYSSSSGLSPTGSDLLHLTNLDNTADGYTGILLQHRSSNASVARIALQGGFFTPGASAITFGLRGPSGNPINERMRIVDNGNVGIGDTTPASLLTVGNGDLFQVNSLGAIVAATGITSSGPITFSSLSAGGVVQAAAGTGLLSVSTLGAASITPDSLDFTEFQDTLDLDAALILNQTTNTWNQTFTGTTTTGLTYTANSLTSGAAITIPHTTSVIANGGSLFRLSSTSVDTATTTGTLLDLSSTASTVGTLVRITNNTAAFTGITQAISMTGQTTGTGLSITGGGVNLLAGGELIDLQMGAATAGNALNIVNSGAYTGTGLINITANSLTSGKGFAIDSSATALTGSLEEITLSGSNAANTGSLLTLTNSGVLNTNTSLIIQHNATGTGNLAFRVNDVAADTTPFVIDGTGQVGIGTAAPSDKLEVVGNIISEGTLWTARTAAVANGWQGITYGNGLFVAVAQSGTNRVMTSPDGINWTARTSATEGNGWFGVTYGNGLFVAVAESGTNRVMTSPDGINWTARVAATDGQIWHEVTYGDGLFVAVGSGTVMTSPDGITWTARTPASANDWHDVTYGNGLFVAVARTGTNQVMTSPDGINWTARVAAPEGNLWGGVTYGNGLFVAVSQSGATPVMTSPNGITWTARTADSLESRDVTYGNGVFVAVGNSGAMTSPDGIIWTTRTLPLGTAIGIAYGNGLFAAVGQTGGVATSGKQEDQVLAHNNVFQGGMSISGPITLSDLSAGGVVQAAAGTGLLSVSAIGAASIAPDSLDFTEFIDAMTLDASTDILATGTNVLSITNTGTGNSFLVNDIAADTTPFVINASGNVGIGTATPTNILSLGNAAAQKFWIENSAAGTVGRALTIAAGGTVAGIADITGGNLTLQSGLGTGTGASTISFQTGTTLTTGTTLQAFSTKMTILGSGNVGIGTTVPAGLLHVSRTGSGEPVLKVSMGGVAGGDVAPAYGVHVSGQGQNNSTEIFGVYSSVSFATGQDSTGVYGEAISAGAAPRKSYGVYGNGIQSNAGGGATAYGVYGTASINGAGATGGTYAGYFDNTATVGALAYGVYVNAATGATNAIPFAVAADGAEKFRVNSSGNVGIGDTNPASLLTVGNGDLFQVNSLGAIVAATGITSSGPITFSSLSAGGVVQAAAGTGLLSVSAIGAASIAPDSLDFTEFTDAMTLDASTDILATGTNVLSITNTGTGNSFLVNDVAADTTPFVIDQSGNVGIGTATPGTPLDVTFVSNTARFGSTAGGNNNLRVTSGAAINVGLYTGSSRTIWADGDLTFVTGTTTPALNLAPTPSLTEAMRITSAGDVGINDTTPDGLLDLDSSATATNVFGITNTGVFTGTGATSVARITANAATTGSIFTLSGTGLTSGYAQDIDVNGAAVLTTGGAINIDGPTGAANMNATTGLVNISTTGAITNTTAGAASGTLFQINGNGAITPTLASISDTSIMTTTGKLLDLTANAATTTTGLFTMNADGLTSGRAINVSSASAALTGSLQEITLSGSNAANTGSLLTLTNSGVLNANTTLTIQHNATGTNNLALRVNDIAADTTPFVIDGTGQVGIGMTTPGAQLDLSTDSARKLTTTTWTTGSDARIKTQVESISDALDVIDRIRPVQFHYTDAYRAAHPSIVDTDYYNFIAQEYQQVFPNSVTEIDGLLYLNSSNMIPYAIAGIKEQQAEIASVTLKTDQNITTVGELQASVDTQLIVIGNKLDALATKGVAGSVQSLTDEDRMTTLETLADQIQLDMNTQVSRTALLETQMQTLTDQLTTLTDFYTTFDLGNLVSKDALGNIDLTKDAQGDPVLLGGKLKATILETGGLVIEVLDPLAPTIGTATILPVETDADKDGKDDDTGSDGMSIVVNTKAMIPMAKGSRIFTNFKNNPNAFSWIEKVQDADKDYIGFTIRLSQPITKETKVDWLLVEEKDKP